MSTSPCSRVHPLFAYCVWLYQNMLRLPDITYKEQRAIRVLQLEHRLFQQGERAHYYHRRQCAMMDPANNTSVVQDGAGQIWCELPLKAKYEHGKRKLKQKLVGDLVHGRDE